VPAGSPGEDFEAGRKGFEPVADDVVVVAAAGVAGDDRAGGVAG
jgi:hypothetical protein